LLNVSIDLESRLNEVTLPFFIAHGGDDKVTDPSVSKLLYESASSYDKAFKLYPGMWHSLTYGEFPENINKVFADVFDWLDERISMGNSRLEREQKHENDKLLHIASSSKK
jgi:acylglycerol lipase